MHQPEDVLSIYSRNAEAFDQQRTKTLFEKSWIDSFLALLKPNSTILDLGCGAGEPIAAYLIEREHSVVGVDFSPEMLRLCKFRFPGQQWIRQDMRNLSLPLKVDGIVAWNSFFHLKPSEQPVVLKRIIGLLKPEGGLLVTVGHEAGEVLGFVNREAVYHASLDVSDYAQILAENNMTLKAHKLSDPDCQGHSVLLAQKNP